MANINIFKARESAPNNIVKDAIKRKKAAEKDRVMRKFVSDESDKDNLNRKGKVIVDGQTTGSGNDSGTGNEEEELDRLEKEAKDDK